MAHVARAGPSRGARDVRRAARAAGGAPGGARAAAPAAGPVPVLLRPLRATLGQPGPGLRRVDPLRRVRRAHAGPTACRPRAAPPLAPPLGPQAAVAAEGRGDSRVPRHRTRAGFRRPVTVWARYHRHVMA